MARPELRYRLRFGAVMLAARVRLILPVRLFFACFKAAAPPIERRCATNWVWKEAPAAEPGATAQPAICGACCTPSAINLHCARRSIGRCAHYWTRRYSPIPAIVTACRATRYVELARPI